MTTDAIAASVQTVERGFSSSRSVRAGIEVAADAGRIDGDVGPQPDGHAIARVSGIVLFGFGTHRENLADVVGPSRRIWRA